MPTTCRSEGTTPNEAPDAHNRMLFGPGVAALTNENPTSAINVSTLGTLDGAAPKVLYDSAMEVALDPLTLRAWRPAVPGVREVFHARFGEHAYPPHTHDVWTLFVVDEGAIRYRLDREEHAAERGTVAILPPHVVHDGRAASSRGFGNRVLYLERDVIGEDITGRTVDRPRIALPGLDVELTRLHEALVCPDDALEAETRLAQIAARIGQSFGRETRDATTELERQDRLAESFRAFLDEHLFEPVTLAEAAVKLDATPTRLARAFTKTFAIPPHMYVTGRRLGAARERILGGQALADVAAEVGFADQAHLTRRFKQFLGTTPKRFARS